MGRGRLRGTLKNVVRVVAGNADLPLSLGVVGFKVLVGEGPVVQGTACHRAVSRAGTEVLFEIEVDSTGSGSVGAPSFTTLTATVTPGSTATYPVTLPSTATDVSATCLNLPSGATCTYSAATGAVKVATSATTPAGTYQITVVFTETLPGAAPAMVFLPIMLLPLPFARKKWAARQVGFIAFLALALTLALASGCGGGSSGTGQTQSPTHVATSSGGVTLTVQ